MEAWKELGVDQGNDSMDYSIVEVHMSYKMLRFLLHHWGCIKPLVLVLESVYLVGTQDSWVSYGGAPQVSGEKER
jgi:hypothetical protein